MSFEFHNSIITKRRIGNYLDPFVSLSEAHTITNSTVQLSEIPSSFTKVTVIGNDVIWSEQSSGIPSENTYVVDYDINLVTFHSSRNGLQLQFNYKGTGLHYIPMNMIYTGLDENNNVSQTLESLIEDTNDVRINAENSNFTTLNNEVNRVSAEEIRINSENNRNSQETSRTVLETSRVNAESNRVVLENGRISAEVVRVNSENTRILSDNARGIAETARVSSENLRITNNTNYTSAENIRKSSEITRVASEVTRIENENIRLSQEENRAIGYQDMINTSKMILKNPISTYSALATAYPTPLIYWTVRVIDTGKLYRFDGTVWIWIDTVSATVYDTLTKKSTVSSVAPFNPNFGDFWLDTSV